MWGSPAHTGKEQERTHFYTVGRTEHCLAPHQNKCGVRRVNTYSNKRLLLLWAPEVSCDGTYPTLHSIRGLCITAGAWGPEGYRAFPSLPAPSVLHTTEGEWEHKAFPFCRAFLVLRAEAGDPSKVLSCHAVLLSIWLQG